MKDILISQYHCIRQLSMGAIVRSFRLLLTQGEKSNYFPGRVKFFQEGSYFYIFPRKYKRLLCTVLNCRLAVNCPKPNPQPIFFTFSRGVTGQWPINHCSRGSNPRQVLPCVNSMPLNCPCLIFYRLLIDNSNQLYRQQSIVNRIIISLEIFNQSNIHVESVMIHFQSIKYSCREYDDPFSINQIFMLRV